MGQYFDEDKKLKQQKKLIKINYGNKHYNLYTTNGVFSKEKFDSWKSDMLAYYKDSRLDNEADSKTE